MLVYRCTSSEQSDLCFTCTDQKPMSSLSVGDTLLHVSKYFPLTSSHLPFLFLRDRANTIPDFSPRQASLIFLITTLPLSLPRSTSSPIFSSLVLTILFPIPLTSPSPRQFPISSQPRPPLTALHCLGPCRSRPTGP